MRSRGVCRCADPNRDRLRDADKSRWAWKNVSAKRNTFSGIPEYVECFYPLLVGEALAQVRCMVCRVSAEVYSPETASSLCWEMVRHSREWGCLVFCT